MPSPTERCYQILREGDRTKGGTDCPGCSNHVQSIDFWTHATICLQLKKFERENE